MSEVRSVGLGISRDCGSNSASRQISDVISHALVPAFYLQPRLHSAGTSPPTVLNAGAVTHTYNGTLAEAWRWQHHGQISQRTNDSLRRAYSGFAQIAVYHSQTRTTCEILEGNLSFLPLGASPEYLNYCPAIPFGEGDCMAFASPGTDSFRCDNERTICLKRVS